MRTPGEVLGDLHSQVVGNEVGARQLTPVELPGGGGYGPPAARDPERVLEDVREGYVSLGRARDEYGVAIDPVTWTVLADETATRRAQMRAD